MSECVRVRVGISVHPCVCVSVHLFVWCVYVCASVCACMCVSQGCGVRRSPRSETKDGQSGARRPTQGRGGLGCVSVAGGRLALGP